MKNMLKLEVREFGNFIKGVEWVDGRIRQDNA